MESCFKDLNSLSWRYLPLKVQVLRAALEDQQFGQDSQTILPVWAEGGSG